jgi:hypothetical protein
MRCFNCKKPRTDRKSRYCMDCQKRLKQGGENWDARIRKAFGFSHRIGSARGGSS